MLGDDGKSLKLGSDSFVLHKISIKKIMPTFCFGFTTLFKLTLQQFPKERNDVRPETIEASAGVDPRTGDCSIEIKKCDRRVALEMSF